MEAELEQLTMDEDQIIKEPRDEQEIWEIKKQIKISFIKKGTAPETEMIFYKIGCLIGKGSFGKVNVGLHKLSRRLVAVKSINLKMQSEEVAKR